MVIYLKDVLTVIFHFYFIILSIKLRSYLLCTQHESNSNWMISAAIMCNWRGARIEWDTVVNLWTRSMNSCLSCASCELGSIQTFNSRSSYTTAQDVLKSSNCRELLTTLCINIDWERGLTEWIPVVSLVCLMHSPVTATCYEQPVLGAHLGSPWLLGLLRRKLWSRSILLARCCTPLLAPTALASSI